MDTNTTLARGRRRALVSSVVTGAVVAVLLGGTAGALPGRDTVDRNDVQRNAITSKHIKDGQVKPADLAKPERWHVVGRAGQPQFFDGGEGDCVWQNAPASSGAPASFRKDPFGRVQLRGVAYVSDGPGGDGACDSGQPGEAEDGIVFVLPKGYRPAYPSFSAVAYQIVVLPGQGAEFPTGPVAGGAVFAGGGVAVFDDAEFDAGPARSARRAQVPAELLGLSPGANR